MKYIIDIEDKPIACGLYKAKAFNSLVFDEVGLSRLEPYDEEDIEEKEDRWFSVGDIIINKAAGDDFDDHNARKVVITAKPFIGMYDVLNSSGLIVKLDALETENYVRVGHTNAVMKLKSEIFF